jgi:hypothetical protein
MSKDLTVAKNNAVTAYEDAGEGFEDVRPEDIAIAFMKVAQALTPEVDDGLAKSGDFINTVSGEVISGSEGFVFQPCFTQALFVEWEPRSAGGAMVGKYEPHDPAVQDAIERNAGSDFGKLTIGDNELIKTQYVYGNILDNEDGIMPEGYVILSFSQTKLKVYKRWLTAMYTIRMHPKPPLHAHRALITTQKETNDFGSFYNFKILPFNGSPLKSLLSPVDDAATLAAGKELRKSAMSGGVKPQEDKPATDDDTDDGDEIPF